MPSTREMLVACTVVLLVFGIGVGLKASGSRWAGGDAWKIGGDFPQFYVTGQILNEHDGARLYDFQRLSQGYREVMPGATLNLPFFNPPLVAVLFRPLAGLSYSTALATLLAVTPILFVGSLWLLTDTFGPPSGEGRALALVAGASFFPFLGYTWLGAQISVIGFAAIAVALREDDRGRPLRSGLVLSTLLYKPTLLVLLIPMLLVGGRFRQLVGFGVGCGVYAIASLALAGSAAHFEFIDRTRWIIAGSTSGDTPFNYFRYVDLNAFFRLLPYGRSRVGYVLLGTISILAAAALVRTWLLLGSSDRDTQRLVWAATLTWSLVLNIYTPFYDAILVVVAAVLAVSAVSARQWVGWTRVKPAMVCAYLTPWIAEVCARSVRVQIFTIALAAFGTVLLVEANRTRGA